LYKRQDDEEYKTTTIRIRKEYYDKLKDIAVEDHRSTNYIINKIIIAYINRETFSHITYDTSLD
jgi:predicted transcriptional regulator